MEFIPFFLLLVTAIIFSAVFSRFHLPWVLALIVAGVVIGPYGLGYLQLNPAIDFMSQIGLIFLMFMAGLETKFETFRKSPVLIAKVAILNGLVPFIVGYAIGYFLDFGLMASLLLGTIFMSSSVAVIMPTLETHNLLGVKLGRTIISSAIVVDIASLVLLSIFLQTVAPVTPLPLPSFYLLLAVILFGFRYALPRVRALIRTPRDEIDLFESEVRIVFAMLLGTVVVFEALGLHPIIAGFFSGLILADTIKSEIMIDKLRTISYGLFIPIFFVVVGANTDFSLLFGGGAEIALVLVIVIGSFLSKFLSGWFAAWWVGFRQTDALVLGFATVPQLSTTLAVVFTAVELGLLEDQLITAMVFLSMISTMVAPIAIRRLVS